MQFLRILLLISILSLVSARNTFDVTSFGAIGDQTTDDSEAFAKTWKAACGSTFRTAKMVIPRGKTFLLKPTSFEGPCKPSKILVQFEGNVVAPDTTWPVDDYDIWLSFREVTGLTVDGHGQLDGKGHVWWKSCTNPNSCIKRPTALGFMGCDNLRVNGLKSANSQRNHISISGCNDANFTNLEITAPEDSPNTDAFNIAHSTFVQIIDANVSTGDDCVAIGTRTSDIGIIRMRCGPGHGISIGSLGIDRSEAEVENIHVRDSIITSATSGARIKTWQGGKGYARKITFDNITLDGTRKPILIDQYYCPHKVCQNQTSAVKISEVTYTNIRGTSATAEAITLSCSETVGCTDIKLEHINITTSSSGNARASCVNAHGTSSDVVPPVTCLLD